MSFESIRHASESLAKDSISVSIGLTTICAHCSNDMWCLCVCRWGNWKALVRNATQHLPNLPLHPHFTTVKMVRTAVRISNFVFDPSPENWKPVKEAWINEINRLLSSHGNDSFNRKHTHNKLCKWMRIELKTNAQLFHLRYRALHLA